ncbi:hypothetical protein AB0E81_22525 [Streptomyces sp. NPDC033538]|uniref:hypothetical protein n=1 Tax=Streptomyces sp. NPDC033538 TaxID=3155367 RepID=UPI0034055D89
MNRSVADTRTGFVRNGIRAAATLLGGGLLVLGAQGTAQAAEAPASAARAAGAQAVTVSVGLAGAVVNDNHDWGVPPMDSVNGNHDWGVPPMDSVNGNHDWGVPPMDSVNDNHDWG